MLKRYCWLIGSVICILSLSAFELKAQSQQIRYGLKSSVYSSGSDLPFWFYANADGKIDQSSSNLINQFHSDYIYRDSTRSFKFSTGFDLSTRLAHDNTIFFRQLYGTINYHGVSASVGRFDDSIGLNEHDLSMGSMLVSRNATPIPKVQLSTDGFVNLPLTDGHFQFNGMLSHGWLEGDRYISNPYLHQKFLYLRYKHKRFDLTAGAVHNVVWGGTHPGVGEQSPYQLPSSFSDFMDVLLGQSSSSDADNIPDNEITNSVGNSVAAYEVKAGINFDQFRLKAYRQFYLEDKVALAFRSPWDGLWGIGIELDDPDGFISEVLWEHLNTKKQNALDYMPRGRTNYYNNGVYRSGWTYEGQVLGNPLIINGPVANFEGGPYPITNNIIIAHHVGIKGSPTDRLSYKAMLTYSRNYGTHYDQGEEPGPYVPLDQLRHDQYSSLLQLNYLIAPNYGLSVQSALAVDIGELYDENRWGFQIGVRWNRIASVL